MIRLIDLLRFWVLRALERALPPDVLYRMLRPVTTIRTAWRFPPRKPKPPQRLPGCFGPDRFVTLGREWRRDKLLFRTIEFFPDRMATPRWRSRCRMNGLEHVQRSLAQGRPVVVAFCHCGPYGTLAEWLRSAGIPIAALVRGNAAGRPLLKRLIDRHSPFKYFPAVFYQDDLPQAVQFLTSGKALMVAVDYEAGKQIDVPVADGWTFRMATGAIRLAARHDAELLPGAIFDEGGWRFRIELGRPVPRELLTGSDWQPAGRHLMNQLFPHFHNRPDQCWTIVDRFRHAAGVSVDVK